MKKIKLYMITHKKVDYIPKGRTPLFVGNGNNENQYLEDNTGDNISSKNKNYCELTGLYWIWKNDFESDYIGIEHYRRFFMNKMILKPIEINKISNILEKYDAIVTRKYIFKEKIYDYYAKNHIESDLKEVEKAIKKLYPEYIESYNTIMNGNCTSMCNMVIMKKKDFNNYCKWLFDILFLVEKNISLEGRDDYQKRVYGFLSERLQNVWFLHNKINYKELPIYYLEGNSFISKLKSLKHIK